MVDGEEEEGMEGSKGMDFMDATREESHQYSILLQRAREQACRDAEVEFIRSKARLNSAKSQVLEDLHAVLREFSVDLKSVDSFLEALKEES